MTPKQISLRDVSEDHKNRYCKVGNLPQVQVGLDPNLIAVDIVAVSLEVCGKTASVDLTETPHEDLTVRELHCECHSCPSGCTCLNFRVPTDVVEKLRVEPDRVFFRCPRGHEITWAQVRGTSGVDNAGYTIDRPLWRVLEDLERKVSAAFRQGQYDYHRRLLAYSDDCGYTVIENAANAVMDEIEEGDSGNANEPEGTDPNEEQS